MSDTIAKVLPYAVDLEKPIKKTYLDTIFATEDNQAHRFDITLKRNGADVTPDSGTTVSAYFIRYADNATVPMTGSVSGSVVSVTLSKACYTKAGQFAMIIKVTTGSTVSTVLYAEGTVFTSSTDTLVDEENIIPSLSDLLAQIDAMEAATEAANTATANANTATGKANTAATNADEKAKAADTAAKGASGWANATMTATALAAGSAPTATVTTASDGHKVITLGIPRGNTGATPQISVEVQTGAAGSEASVSVSGTAENPVIHLTIPRGDTGNIGSLTINGKKPDASGTVTLGISDISGLTDALAGAGSVKTVAGVGPDSTGNVALNAENVGARASDWMPSASDVGALPAGGTSADSSKLGGKAPEYYIQPINLLDNSDFRNPVNQRGFVSGNTVTAWSYFIDRWFVSNNDASVSIDTNGLQPQIADNASVSQRIEASKFHEGKTYTFAVGLSDGSVITASGIYPSDETDWTVIAISENENLMIRLAKTTNGIGFCQIMAKTNVTVRWAALYEGEYTADTLPPYVPKGYAQELAACQYYAYPIPAYALIPGYLTTGGTIFKGVIPISPMRNAGLTPSISEIPKVTIRTVSGYSSLATHDSPGTPSSIEVADYIPDAQQVTINVTFGSSIGTNNTPAFMQIRLGSSPLISLDL